MYQHLITRLTVKLVLLGLMDGTYLKILVKG